MNKNVSKKDRELLNACYFGNQSMAFRLIKEGADPSYKDPRDGWAGIHYAARWGHISVVYSLVKAGVDINIQTSDGETPLHKASSTNRVQLCVWLLKNGADPNICNILQQKPADLSLSKEVQYICNHFDHYCKIINDQKIKNKKIEKY